MLSALAALSLASLAVGQQIGTVTPESHPPISFQTCSRTGGCTATNGGVVLDANYRWVHDVNGYTSCPIGNPDATLCPTAEACAQNCALEGADYANTYGVTTTGDSLQLTFSGGGARVYLLDETGNYKNFQVLGKEFTFDVDVSQLPCGYNGALYFSEMPIDGGLSDMNKAGAAYGTGYCDSQCPTGTNFFGGIANFDHSLGACCNEMDIWEANSHSTALTPHPCNVTGEYACSGTECSNLCDPDGCDFNPFRMGNHSLYGPGGTVDTTKPFTVVTQFLTNTTQATGTLSQINRIYVQDDRIILNSNVNLPSLAVQNSITQSFCSNKESVLGDASLFDKYGGLAQMGKSLARGGVLVMSLWDSLNGMSWLDGLEGSNAAAPGALRGDCTYPAASDPSAAVVFSNIRVGDLGSTFLQSTSATEVHYGQCGGMYYTGSGVCAEGSACSFVNEWYSQCL